METVAGMLILIASMVILAAIFHRSLAYFNTIEQRSQAAGVARNVMANIRAAALDYPTFAAGLTAYSAASYQIGSFTATTSVVAQSLYAPSTQLESTKTDPRLLANSAWLARVRVTWPGLDPNHAVEIEGLVAEPLRTNPTIAITPAVPAYTAPGLDLSAQLLDAGGNPIDDVSFLWEVDPGTVAAADITPSDRMGKTARLVALPITGIPLAATNTVRVTVRALYAGQPIEATTPPITLP